MYGERFLLEHVRTRPNIVVRFGWRVEDFADDSDGVTLNIVRERDGARETWRSAYLVGCDGGQGLVRRTLGIRYSGESLQQAYMGGRMFSTHVRVPTLARDFLRKVRGFQYWVVSCVITIKRLRELAGKSRPMAVRLQLGAPLMPRPVSYTHLRAHETRHDLVCRLLLE